MVTVENFGNDLEEVTITLNKQVVKLNENSDSKILYLAVEELSRVILKMEKNKDFHELVQNVLEIIPSLTKRRAAIGLGQVDIIVQKLKEKIGEI